MATQIIAGRVNLDGSIAAGRNFFVRPLGGGAYLVEFATELPNVPTVVLTENHKSWTDFDFGGGDTRDNAVLVAVDTKGFKVVTGQKDGSKVDRNFAFIAAVKADQDAIPTLIWGDINAAATTYSGAGFEATGLGSGVYLVDFEGRYDELESVVLTQNFTNWSAFSFNDGSTLDNAVIVAAKSSQFKYITGDSKGTKLDRNCSFIAVATGGASAPAPRCLFGNVNASGTTRQGSGGFTTGKDTTTKSSGTYLIKFDTPFQGVPAIVLTQNYRDWTDFQYAGGNTCDNAVVVAIDNTHAKVITGQDDGSKVDRNFGFLIVG